MVIHLHIEPKSSEKEVVLHSIPCKVHGDEPANVSGYFEPYIRKVDDEHYVSSFRGHRLHGKKIAVPKGYQGIVFTEHKKPDSKDGVRHLYSTGMFSEFTYWNFDKIPSKNDPMISALDWLDIAEALHS